MYKVMMALFITLYVGLTYVALNEEANRFVCPKTTKMIGE